MAALLDPRRVPAAHRADPAGHAHFAASPMTNTSGRPSTRRSGPTPAPARSARPGARGRRRAGAAARRRPHQRARRDHRPAVEADRLGIDLLDRPPEQHLHAPRLERAPGVLAERGMHGADEPVERLDEDDPRPARSRRGKSLASTIWNSSMSAPAISTPVGPPPTMTKVSRPACSTSGAASAASNCFRMCVRIADGVGDGLQRERVLVDARHVERLDTGPAPGRAGRREWSRPPR